MEQTTKKKARVVEIGPRDGFQSVKTLIPTAVKLEVIDGLVKAGFPKIQITSFVNPKAVPQMQDATELVKTVQERYPQLETFALIPNFHGAQSAVEAGLKEVTPVISLSVSHNQANVKRSQEQSLEEIGRIRGEFPDLKLTLDVATVFGCPFEGKMEIPPLIDLVGKLHKLGIRAFTLCDTIGVAYPQQVREVLRATRAAFADCELNIHIHDTRNMGILNSYTALLEGADSLQAAIGGLGGCPFAPGATGNTASEDLIYLLEQEGYDTGVDFNVLLETAKLAKEKIEGSFSGHHIMITTQQCGYN